MFIATALGQMSRSTGLQTLLVLIVVLGVPGIIVAGAVIPSPVEKAALRQAKAAEYDRLHRSTSPVVESTVLASRLTTAQSEEGGAAVATLLRSQGGAIDYDNCVKAVAIAEDERPGLDFDTQAAIDSCLRH